MLLHANADGTTHLSVHALEHNAFLMKQFRTKSLFKNGLQSNNGLQELSRLSAMHYLAASSDHMSLAYRETWLPSMCRFLTAIARLQ